MKAPEHQIVQGHLSNLMRQSFVDHVALSFQECPSSLPPPPIRVYGHSWIHWHMGQVLSLAYATTISSLVTKIIIEDGVGSSETTFTSLIISQFIFLKELEIGDNCLFL